MDMRNKEYRNGNFKVVVQNGKVIYSDTEYCVVGEKPNMDFLKKCGWYLANRKKMEYGARGTKNGNNFI